RRGEEALLLLAGGADVGELLALDDVHFEVVASRVLADDHALIDARARADEERAAVFEVPERIVGRLAVTVGDEDAVPPPDDVALVGRIFVKQPIEDGGPARIREELGLVADQSPRRGMED